MRTPRTLSLTIGLCLLTLAPSAVAQRRNPRGRGNTGTPASTAPATTAAPAVLRMTYVPGQTIRYVTHSVQTAPAPLGETRTTGHVEIQTVSVRPDGSAQLRMRITGMDVEGANVTDAARQQIQRGVSNMTLTYTQDPRGHIVERAAPTGISAEFRPLVEGMLQSLDQMWPQLPEGPVSVGDHWTEHRTMHLSMGPSMALDVDINFTYTLAAATPGQAATINFQMTMGMGRGGGQQIQGNTVSGQGNATGNMVMDLAHGALTSSHAAGEMNMHMVAANGRTADVHTTFSNDMGREGGASGGAAAPAAAH